MRIEAGRFRGRLLPRARIARPISGRLRRSLFSVLADRLPGARVLDAFAGVGGMGLEALSRGAASLTLVDQDPVAVEALAAWITKVGARDEARAVCADALRGRLPAGPFDLVFLDPPFSFWDGPDGAELLARAVALLDADGWVAAKVPVRLDLPRDPRWRLLRRREMGSSAWVLVVAGTDSPPTSDDPGNAVKGPSPQADAG